jgi:hypothetical protein
MTTSTPTLQLNRSLGGGNRIDGQGKKFSTGLQAKSMCLQSFILCKFRLTFLPEIKWALKNFNTKIRPDFKKL